MIHARNDYNDPRELYKKVGLEEPVFLLRAQDVHAPELVREWAALVRQDGNTELANHIFDWADKMVLWQRENGCKKPDTPTKELV